jgi:hypothetical protein
MATAPATLSRFPIRRAVPADAPHLRAQQQRAFAAEGRLSGSRAIPPLAEGGEALTSSRSKRLAPLWPGFPSSRSAKASGLSDGFAVRRLG